MLLFGQSAGAASVATHLAMPGSRGLFTRAGLQSGGAGSGNLSFALRRTDALAGELGCTQPLGPARLACLREVPFHHFIALQTNRSVLPALGASGRCSCNLRQV